MEVKPDASLAATFNPATVRGDVVAGLVSSTVAIPLAMAFGMFAFVTLGDEYFAYGAMAGLMSAFIAGVVCVVLGDRSTRRAGWRAWRRAAGNVRARRGV